MPSKTDTYTVKGTDGMDYAVTVTATGSVTVDEVKPLDDSVAPPNQGTRNVFQQPFGVNAVWNVPIGKGGGNLVSKGTGPHGGQVMKYSDNTGPVYEAVNITPPTYIENDEALLLFGPKSPQQPVTTNNVAWSGGQQARCSATQKPAGFSWPIPPNANFLDAIGTTPNASSAVLQADRRTIDSWQPTVVCGAGGKVVTETNWGKQDIFANDVTAAYGSHGGSGMSAIGGVIRVGEVAPGNSTLVNGVKDVFRHALGVGFNSHMFDKFGSRFWPARNNDTGNEGLLLALLPSFDHNSLTTGPGRSLAWACINYGWYLVDCTGWDAMNLPGEYSYGDSSVSCPTGRTQKQWETDWGFGIDNNNPSASFRNDIKTICKNLYAITNNGASSIGGGAGSGGRLQPDAAEAVDPDA